MNKDILHENRVHGNITFPMGVYQVIEDESHTLFDYHWHEETEFLYMQEGTAVFWLGTIKHELQAGDALFIPSGTIHAGFVADLSTPCLVYAIVFDLNLLSGRTYDVIQSKYIDPLLEQTLFLPSLLKPHTFWENSLIAELVSIVEFFEKKPVAYELLIKAKLYNLFAGFIANLQEIPQDQPITTNIYKIERLKKVLQFIDESYPLRIQIKDVASVIAMSEGHFCRFFKAMVRKTPMDYINTVRINQAAKLLSHSDKKVIDIAMEVGFENPSYFIKLFKWHKKCTPSDYRKLEKQKNLPAL
ncbi:AraC family transcriptional regulator [Paenibacillus psychroresistens]|uniref:AraC family transcriptional regulator n=1 Tax=Paenibacillus psychroresistens TaxID=1778678 RepID=A0A6B8RFY3_9BACL|nr:AraC family transcriptional regulator [Paenibacillus psychroresistens]QGQ94857.1 AraC family transcriptional regulator [Paenibacillus psychroresistens]